jgi:UDP-glucose 4-epimerase
LKILVTGGLGFIGHNVVQQLEQQGHDVIIIDNRSNYGVVPTSEHSYLIQERLNKIKTKSIYMTNVETKDPFFKHIFNKYKPEVVIHLASFPRQTTVSANPIAASKVMVQGVINMCELCTEYKVKRFVFISSSMVYGNFVDQALEQMECRPQGQYGIMKLAGEWLVQDYAKRGCLDYTIIRPSAVYGPGDVSDRVVAKFMLNAMNDKTLKVRGAKEMLDFTYVDDAANGIVSASLSSNAANKIYNITRGYGRTLKEAAKVVISVVGKGEIEVKNKDDSYPSRGTLGIFAAYNDFKFEPKIDIEEGFQRYYDYLKDSPFWSQKTV